jgi:hypothetical protein
MRDIQGETPAHKAARAQNLHVIHELRRMAPNLTVPNHDEDTAEDILSDKARHWNADGGGEQMRSIRALAKARRDGTISLEEFRRLRIAAVDASSGGRA